MKERETRDRINQRHGGEERDGRKESEGEENRMGKNEESDIEI